MKEWVRNTTPHPMGLSLKKIQGILNMEKHMDNDCFNMVMHLLGCDESFGFLDPPKQYMDLRFCVSYHNYYFRKFSINMFLSFFTQTTILDSTQDRKFCDKTTIQMLATLFDSPPGNDYNISSCNMVSKIFCPLFSWLS